MTVVGIRVWGDGVVTSKLMMFNTEMPESSAASKELLALLLFEERTMAACCCCCCCFGDDVIDLFDDILNASDSLLLWSNSSLSLPESPLLTSSLGVSSSPVVVPFESSSVDPS